MRYLWVIERVTRRLLRLNGPEQIKLSLEGIAFKDGEPMGDQQVQQKLAA
jgi:putative transposase